MPCPIETPGCPGYNVRRDGSCTTCTCKAGHPIPVNVKRPYCAECYKIKYRSQTEFDKVVEAHSKKASAAFEARFGCSPAEWKARQKASAKQRYKEVAEKKRRQDFIEKYGETPENHRTQRKQKTLARRNEERPWRGAIARASKYKLPIDPLKRLMAAHPIPNKCPVLGIPLERNKNGKTGSPNSPSIDRIVPEVGYIVENVRVISQRANSLKGNATLEELEALTEYVRRNKPKKYDWLL